MHELYTQAKDVLKLTKRWVSMTTKQKIVVNGNNNKKLLPLKPIFLQNCEDVLPSKKSIPLYNLVPN